MSRGPRQRIAVGVYQDVCGLACTVKAVGHQREKRFPFGTDLKILKAWRQRTRGELLMKAPAVRTPQRPRHTLAADVTAYLTQRAGLPGARADGAHLAAWVELLGTRPRGSLTTADVRVALATWRTTGQRRRGQTLVRPLAPQTLRHRLRVLRELFRALDGPGAPTPCDGVPRPTIPQTTPQDVDVAVIRKVLAALASQDAPTHARLLVLATTGKRPVELMRATPADLWLRRRIWRVKPAKGGEPQQLHLNREMVAAWRAFMAADAWGPYDTTRYAKLLRRAGWPTWLRPYNVRHALAMAILRAGGDLGDVQAHMGHKSIETTRRFYAGILSARERQTSRLLEGRLPSRASRPVPAGRLHHAPQKARKRA